MRNVINIEHALIAACRRNDKQSQFQLYEKYSGAMFNTCLRMLGNRDDAQDALQEAFIDAFRNIHQFQGKSTFGAWLKRIIINKCINSLDQKKRLNWENLNGKDVAQSQSSEVMIELSPEMLNQAIAQLPDGCRTVFTLKCMEGYDHQEISEILKVSVSTSKSQLSRAKELLRVSLTKKLVS